MVRVYITCVKCGKQFEFDITDEQYKRIQGGQEHIQDILPHMTATAREMFISKICSKCWDEIFGEDE